MIKERKKIISLIKKKFKQISFCLNEKSKRIWAASEAKIIGHGGIKTVHMATLIDNKTIRKGIKEILQKEKNIRIRKTGGGRKKLSYIEKHLKTDLEKLIESTTRGAPDSPLKWSSKSSYKISEELKKQGYTASQKSVYNLLKEMNYSLQSNRKKIEGSNHPDRNEQFEYINDNVKKFQEKGNPAISVDTKKKENIGNYKNAGTEYHKKKQPIEVQMYDFPDKSNGKIAPYGVYDIGKNKGWVSIGISADTAEFAVNTIKNWWNLMGKSEYSKCSEILITADCGGSNGNRVRLWKYELQKLSNKLQKTIRVCHFPPGTSKWNKIEHRLFSYITKNWRGRPLETLETVVQLIANTTTKTGLKIKAIVDTNQYEKGKKIENKDMEKINIKNDDFHGEWNYRILPNK